MIREGRLALNGGRFRHLRHLRSNWQAQDVSTTSTLNEVLGIVNLTRLSSQHPSAPLLAFIITLSLGKRLLPSIAILGKRN